MKILIDMQSVQAGSGKGGIGRYSYNLLEYIIKNNISWDIHILLNANLSLDVCAKLYRIIEKEKVHTFEVFPNAAEKVKENYFYSESSKLTKEFIVSLINPDLFFITSFVEGYFDDVVSSMEGIFPFERTVIILYDLIPLVQKEAYLKDKMIARHYLDKVDKLSKSGLLLSISKFSKYEGIEMLNLSENEIVNISSGVDKKFQPLDVSINTKEKLYKKYNLKNKFLMYTSSYDIRKNQINLILAFNSIDYNIRKDYQLLLIGNGSKLVLDNIKGIIAEHKLEDHVLLLGYIDDEDLLNLYNLASLFVFPSTSEGFGLPALEAMSCGIPTIGSENTSIIEVINNKDAFFNPTDIQSIANKIKQVLEDDDFANKLKQDGLVQAKTFSWDNSANKALEALEKKYKSLDFKDRIYKNKYDVFIKKLAEISNIEKVANQEIVSLSKYIDKNMFTYQRKIGIISTWNTRCGIASYSKYLSTSFINQSVVLAPKINKNTLVSEDENNVARVWTLANDDLTGMYNYIINSKLEVIFIQFNYGFFNFKSLSRFITSLVDLNIRVYITLHSTVDSVKNKNKRLEVIDSLTKCSAVFIHTEQDIINLNKIGIRKNVVLLNQGIINIPTDRNIQKKKTIFKIATYGFFLKTKGFLEMIETFKILKDDNCNVSLTMLNAKYSDEASGELISSANSLIDKYGLKDYVDLNTDYLSDEETISTLQDMDLIVYPYRTTGESSSAAVRMAIASQTNIAVTPQSIFDEVKDFVFMFDSDTIEDMAIGIKEAINLINKNDDNVNKMNIKREKFRKKNLYSKLSMKLKNILLS